MKNYIVSSEGHLVSFFGVLVFIILIVFELSNTGYVEIALADGAGLVGAFGFSEGTATATADSSSTSNNGSIVGATWTTGGKFGNALSFNGTSSYVDLAKTDAYDSLTQGTIEAWVKWSGSGYDTIFSADSGACSNPFELAISSGKFSVWAGPSGCSATFNATVSLGPTPTAWHHVAYVVSSTGNQFYLDGVLKTATYAKGNSSSKFYFSSASSGVTHYNIGRSVNDNNETFQGVIDELRIYNRALTAAEIQADMSAPVIPDTSPPAVTMTAPANNSTVSGTINVTANATDNIGVAGVQFLLDGANLAAEDTQAAYAISLDTTTLTNTSHIFSARARDAAGNAATATAVTVTVNNPPKLIITKPTNNATINNPSVDITYTETGDLTGVDGVRFQLDGGPIMQDPTFDGNFQITNVVPGTHTLTGFLTQLEMPVMGSDATPITFTTVAPDTIPPTVYITAPAGGSTVSGTLNITADAADNVGVRGVQFVIDGTNFGAEDTQAPYSVAWDTTTFSNGQHTITAVARDAALNSTTSAPVSVTVNNLNDPARLGQWSTPVSTPMVAVHGILLNTGKVLTWSSGGTAQVWDTSTNTFTPAPDNFTDIFCAGHVVLTNGQPFVAGGGGAGPGNATTHVDIFNMASSTWSQSVPMNLASWYPTETVLPDGRILSTGGANGCVTCYVATPQVYNPKTRVWTSMGSSGNNANTPSYPFMFVLPDGRVAFTGGSEYDTITQVLDVSAQTWTTVDNRVLAGSSAVMYQPGKIMKSGEAADSGFSGPAARTTYVIDFNQPNPTWRQTSDMAFSRSFMNLTALPDGNVLVTGGETTKDGSNPANAVKEAELWNPTTETWTTMARAQRPRLYHSIAILLPDGRVLVSGGGADAGVPDELTAEYYSPPYLFKGTRPSITSSPSTVQYGAPFFVGTPDSTSIASVSLIKSAAVTHFFNQEQRFMNLSFTQTSGGLTVNAPANANLATPGQYMLFIINSNGVPSVAPFVTLSSPLDDTTPPTAPTSLTATGGVGSVILNWISATDNVGVAKYNVHRSTITGFVPSVANRIAQVTTTDYTDGGLSAGTYYYVVTAEDAAGNVSSPSNEASATVTAADTTPPTVSITSPSSGSTVSGIVSVAAAASDDVGVVGVQFKLDGNNLGAEDTAAPYQISWDSTTAANGTHALSAIARDAAGNRGTSSAVNITVSNAPQPSTLAIDQTVYADQGGASPTNTTAAFSTTAPNELLLAFIASDTPSGVTTSVTAVTGAGLTWELVKRTNAQAGTSEIWRAFALTALTNVAVKATFSTSVSSSITVVTFKGVSTVGTNGSGAIGAAATANAASGAPSASLVTTKNNSWVFGVGNDWDNAIGRTIGPNQAMVHQYLSPVGDTYWVQRRTNPTPSSGTTVTINDTAPTTDRYNLSIVEILPQ